MSTKTKILITGATGYIGGSILTRLLQRSDLSQFDIRVLIRSAEKARKLEDLGLGLKPVMGSHTDESVMVKATSEVDVVIASANSESLVAAQLTLKGMKKRFEETGKPPIFIHTSGTGLYIEFAGGMHSNAVVYDDANPDQIETIAPTQPHRNVDLEILAADTENYVKTYIVLPSTVYGIASGPLFDAEISNRHSVQVPALIKAAFARTPPQGGTIGEGKNVWPNVEIHELADLYNVLLDSALTSQNPQFPGHGREGIYNAVNGEHNFHQLAEVISQALVSLGLGEDPSSLTFSAEEEQKFFGPFAQFFGTNSRCLATRAKSLGWKPVKTTKELLASVKPEIEALVASGKTGLPDISAHVNKD
ncbi:NAD-binding protein [Dendrothele bispora CBS 962.96]|uniref:NAD-binding protein n=1 Tax=Dendrothele bispora (strain CBS 962.96) TaxID=1314807 RepID=A0A4S8L149_DENBC|nr:NAD-binding protein [Dendrothele bispora CBS 962.96]